MRVYVAYDIADDGRRARLSNRLLTCGERRQESLFECRVDTNDWRGFAEDLRHMVDRSVDVLHVIPLCASCAELDMGFGNIAANTLDRPYWLIDDL